MGLNFAVAVSQETLEKSNRVMGLYERASDKKKGGNIAPAHGGC